MEIEGAYRSLNGTVLQTMSREFQRYAPLLADLRGLARGGRIPTAAMRSVLERENELYGPSGSVPRLVSLVGLSSLSDPSSTSILGTDGKWKSAQSPFALPVPEFASRQ